MDISSMLKKRLRVFENILHDEKIEIKLEENFQEFSNLKELIKDSEMDEMELLPDLDLNSDFSMMSLYKNENEKIEKNYLKFHTKENLFLESNSLIMIFPTKIISEQDFCSFLTFYGDIESFHVNSQNEIKSEISVKFYDLRSANKAFNEIHFNFNKLLNIFEKEKFSVIFENNKAEIFDKFYMLLQFSANAQDRIRVLQFIESYAEIEKIFHLNSEEFERLQENEEIFENYKNYEKYFNYCGNSGDEVVRNFNNFHSQNYKNHSNINNQTHNNNNSSNISYQNCPERILIKFYNSKEKQVVTFLLKKITNSGIKLDLSESQIKNCKIFLEKNEKITDVSSSDYDREESQKDSISLISNLNLNLDSNNKFKCNEKENESIMSNQSITAKSLRLKKLLEEDTGNNKINNFRIPQVPKSTLNNVNSSNKENIQNFGNSNSYNNNKINNSTKKGIYKIVYDQNYSGIKKRNTPDEERKKYIINIQNIMNEKDLRTTLMVKNIPTYTTQVELLKIINKNYSKAYNFFYLPIDFNKKLNAGYAFINFKSAKLIINFFLEFEGKPWDLKNSNNKLCYLSYARIQGFRSICEHFQKSGIMKQVDEKVKPIIKLD